MSRTMRMTRLIPLLTSVAMVTAFPVTAQQQTAAPVHGPVSAAFKVTPPTVAESPDSGTSKRADKDLALVLMELQTLGAKPIESRSVEEARTQPTPADAVKAVLKDQGKDPMALMAAMKVSKKDMTYPAGAGSQPIRIYTPEGAGSTKPLPVIVYYHGGGWVIADIDTYEASAMALAKGTNAIVASVEYRHAPEDKFPAAHQDAFAAYKWVVANAAKFNGDGGRVAVAGESAGGNLAANVAIMARDQHVEKPVHMLLVYPVAGSDLNTPSYMKNQNAVPLSKGAIMWFLGKTLAKPEDAKNPMLNLTTMVDLKGLPSATVITAGIDPLMSDGQMLVEKLQAAGVQTSYQDYPGMTHEFFGMGLAVAAAKRAEDLAAMDLKKAFASKARSSND